jgi:hypothetical protein
VILPDIRRGRDPGRKQRGHPGFANTRYLHAPQQETLQMPFHCECAVVVPQLFKRTRAQRRHVPEFGRQRGRLL